MHLSPAAYVIRVFKGVRATARAIGRDPSAVSRWKISREYGGCDGEVPGPVRKIILSKAQELGLHITSEHLDFGYTVIEQEPYE